MKISDQLSITSHHYSKIQKIKNMKNQTNISDNFKDRLIGGMTKKISMLTDKYFEFFHQFPGFNDKEQELNYKYRDFTSASTMNKTGWFFLVCILMPCLAIFDYASIKSFVDYLSFSAGGFIGSLLAGIGGTLFILLEIGIGFLILHSKGKPVLRVVAIMLAVVIVCVPSYLILTTYQIDPAKTDLLLYKTIALIVVSVIIHILFFLVISDIWAGINYYIYCIKLANLKRKNPIIGMKKIRNELQELYPDFDQYIRQDNPENVDKLINNRAWFVKSKLQNGSTNDDYDLSDYDPTFFYAPLQNY